MSDHRGFECRHFALANPEGSEEENVPLLLRRLADAIEKMGSIQILDITYEDCGEGSPSVAVYFVENDDGGQRG